MQETTALIIPALIAGVLTFLAPCTLPMVPGYLGFISGVSLSDLNDPARVAAARFRVFLNGLFFVVGFSLVFIIFGSFAGFAGAALVPYRLWLGRVGGIFIIIFGLFMLRVVPLPFLAKETRMKTPLLFQRGRPLNAFLLGAAFGFGWTPCIGPILASILLLASTTSTVMQGAFLLTVFSLGLALPFLLIAVGIGHASTAIKKITPLLNVISVIGGIFLILLGVTLLTDKFSFWLSYAYSLFDFIQYGRLLDYL